MNNYIKFLIPRYGKKIAMGQFLILILLDHNKGVHLMIQKKL